MFPKKTCSLNFLKLTYFPDISNNQGTFGVFNCAICSPNIFCYFPSHRLHSQVVQKLIDWGADVNQLRFDTDVSHAALVEEWAGRCGKIHKFLLSKNQKMMKLQLFLKICWT